MILAGDIGGTKTNLALYKYENESLSLQVQHQFASQKYASFSDVVNEFIALCGVKEMEAVCLGIAGPVVNGVCRTTNLPWVIETEVLQKECSTHNVKLLNDLEATAYGMLYLKNEEFLELNPNAKRVEANCAVIAAGTGLGEAMLFFDGKEYHPVGSEGGHCDFAPLNPLQDELLVWLRQRYKEHVSMERILCGDGISTLYEFLKERGSYDEPKMLLEASSEEDKNALISRCALEEKNPLCVEVLEIFSEIYGAEAGNLALKSLSLGGVFIGGGIAPKILPFLEEGRFLEAFKSKGRFRELLSNMQVKVALNQETALIGSAHYALDKLVKVHFKSVSV